MQRVRFVQHTNEKGNTTLLAHVQSSLNEVNRERRDYVSAVCLNDWIIEAQHCHCCLNDSGLDQCYRVIIVDTEEAKSIGTVALHAWVRGLTQEVQQG
jgi:hypothetical protein